MARHAWHISADFRPSVHEIRELIVIETKLEEEPLG